MPKERLFAIALIALATVALFGLWALYQVLALPKE